jgi:hypothetical protein
LIQALAGNDLLIVVLRAKAQLSLALAGNDWVIAEQRIFD